jgi:hypothetical protein
MSNQLTDKQKALLAHALFCYNAGIGHEEVRLDVIELATQLGVMPQYAILAHAVVKDFEDTFGKQKKKDE